MTPRGSRKRAKPSPSGADSPSPASPSNAGRDRSDSQPQGRASWYPGSWSTTSRMSKAAPVTEVARESISVAQNVASSLAESSTSLFDSPKRNRAPSIQLIKKAGASTRSLPANVTTTRVNIASDGSASTTALDKLEDSPAAETPATGKEISSAASAKHQEKAAEGQELAIDDSPEPNTPHAGHAAEQPSGWFSWIYPTGLPQKETVSNPESTNQAERPGDSVQATNKADIETDTALPTEQGKQVEQEQDNRPSQAEATTDTASTAQKRSWLQMWYGSSSSKQEEQATAESSNPPPTVSDPSASKDVDMSPKDPTEHEEAAGLPQPPAETTKSSGWSFWSKDPPKDATPGKPQEVEAVEASVAPDTPSRTTGLEPDPEANVNITKKGSLKVKPPKDSRLKDGAVSAIEATSTFTPSKEPQAIDSTASKQLQNILPNQVLPRFEDTYKLEESPSLLQSLGRFLHYSKGPEHNHVSRVKEPPRIKRALAIGVHGYFPAPLIRTVLGQPTGTSIRFSNMAAESIRKWTVDHGYSCDIEKIALEGEGRISERVDLLWKLLLNWMEEIRKADFILVACHSQGVPVSIMLVAKLISFGCVNASRVGICAMAGVNMGPFSSYRSRWISGSAGELFDFELPSSKVSQDYEAALRCALDFGVRISYVGSIDDQLVSLESALFSPIAHPYIYRSVFVDGRVHAPSFVSHLVGFALKLRNLGIPDHGLIRELSTPLAGSLYTGDGHSRLYDDEAVYYMAVQFALETSTAPDATLNIKRSNPSAASNPYILPFAMRGLLEEEHVRRELQEETMELLRQFDDWKPSSKVLKDVKFRLEGIRSKL
ncbi:uncharacterized protein N7484_009477 [Penicillium longicatenatum]|uniref:uncharacterized protein n=1 Tax=Penicillium longicatenatum TaxID=1561947 RepID=UPI0025487C78|nr:uncharacterized protein N7484_009477 [Penicillium longicatenatum]KAJ5636164.1 hypothetical protein N7484_009477 [Penicillium longicatenatum]